MHQTLTEIGHAFRIAGELTGYETIKNGNINQTYRAVYRTLTGETNAYIFQKVNTTVFKNPTEIMQNIDRVTTHLRAKNPGTPTLYYFRTLSGENYTHDRDGGFWRVANCIDSVTFDTCDDPNVLRGTGEAFGRFQTQLADFDGSVLYETIPDFHNTRKRLETLFADAETSPRTPGVTAELYMIRAYTDTACLLSDRYARHEFPVRVTHNDTKANNVLFDRETLRPLTIIDLDTVMPGMVMYDFGDAVRFLASTSAEDEPIPARTSFDTTKFKSFAEGFLSQVKDTLTPAEKQSMVLGTFSITVELAARFLNDYLNGDVYFKTNYPVHNLVRARCQLKLAEDILRKKEELEAIVKDALGRYF